MHGVDPRLAKLAKLIHLAFMATVPVGPAIAWLATRGQAAAPEAIPPSFVAMHGVMAALALALGFLLPRQVVGPAAIAGAAERALPAGETAAVRAATRQGLVGTILQLALFECVAIHGLLLSLLSHEMRWCLIAGSVALAAMALVRFPEKAIFDAVAGTLARPRH